MLIKQTLEKETPLPFVYKGDPEHTYWQSIWKVSCYLIPWLSLIPVRFIVLSSLTSKYLEEWNNPAGFDELDLEHFRIAFRIVELGLSLNFLFLC